MPRAALTEQDLTQLRRNMEPKGMVSMTPMVKAFHKTTRSIYRSKWEAAYANKLELEKRTGIIFQYWYEPMSLWLPGKIRFKPDFMVKYAGDPVCEIVEVKGFSKNRRDGITRLKIAAALFPCFVWRMVWMKKGGGFDGEYV